MEEIYFTIALVIFGAVFSIFKDWKNKADEDYVRGNSVSIFAAAVIVIGAIGTCHFSGKSFIAKSTSDSLANERQHELEKKQQEIIVLQKEAARNLTNQLASTNEVLEFSKRLNTAQGTLSESQLKNSSLQEQLYAQVVGGDVIKEKIAITIIVNENDFLPVWVDFYPDFVKTQNLAKCFSLSHPVEERNGKRQLILVPKLSYETSILFIEQCLQYKIVSDLRDVQMGVTEITFNGTNENSNPTTSFKVIDEYRLINPDTISGKKVMKMFSNRIFANDANELASWNYFGLPVPPHTQLVVDSLNKTEKIMERYYRVVLKNKQYFEIEFILQNEGSFNSATTEGTIVDKFAQANPNTPQRYKTYPYVLTMKATFASITKGDPKTIEYKKWASYLFSKLKKVNYAL